MKNILFALIIMATGCSSEQVIENEHPSLYYTLFETDLIGGDFSSFRAELNSYLKNHDSELKMTSIYLSAKQKNIVLVRRFQDRNHGQKLLESIPDRFNFSRSMVLSQNEYRNYIQEQQR